MTQEDEMRIGTAVIGLLALAALAGCSSPTYGGGSGGGGGGGGPSGEIIVGNILFKSAHNGSQNPAIDSGAGGSTVTWPWAGTGTVPHNTRAPGADRVATSTIG